MTEIRCSAPWRWAAHGRCKFSAALYQRYADTCRHHDEDDLCEWYVRTCEEHALQ